MSYSKTLAEFERRNLKIYMLFKEGQSMADIAEQEHISVPRVHQIIDRERKREKKDVVPETSR